MVPLAERLWRRVDRSGDCWEWQGCRHPTRGYGQIGRGGKGAGLVETHRASWEVTYGPIPAGLFVLHSCDNPPCVRPDHLSLGTPADNVRDMQSKGRAARGFMLPHTRLSDEQVAEIRRRYVREFERYRYGWRSNGADLAKEFGISRGYVDQLVRGLYRRSA